MRGNQEPYRWLAVPEADVRSGLTDPILEIKCLVGARVGRCPSALAVLTLLFPHKVVGWSRYRKQARGVSQGKAFPYLVGHKYAESYFEDKKFGSRGLTYTKRSKFMN